MIINDTANSSVLEVTANGQLLNVQTSGGSGIVSLTMDQINTLFPALAQMVAAIKETIITAKMQQRDTLAAQIASIQTQIDSIDAEVAAAKAAATQEGAQTEQVISQTITPEVSS